MGHITKPQTACVLAESDLPSQMTTSDLCFRMTPTLAVRAAPNQPHKGDFDRLFYRDWRTDWLLKNWSKWWPAGR